jgi:phosphatidylserine/phosphatidylglycerophosphate/cardiolipin synthase-like enzyme
MRFVKGLVLGAVIVFATISITSLKTRAAPLHDIIINEIHYDPAGLELEGEWVELRNSGNQTININNWTLSDQDGGVDITFPYIDIPPGAYFLVHTGGGQNSTSIVDGKAEFFMWKSSSIWSPTGDDCLLANETDVTIDFVSYGQWNGSSVDDPPVDFPYTHSNASADEGFSIALASGQFRQSIPTPLEDNREDVYEPLLLTEVYYNPHGENEYMRVHNSLAYDIDISFWYLTDGEGIVAFPPGTVLSSNQSFTVAQNSTNFLDETLVIPDYEYENEHPSSMDMIIVDTTPVLANDGDEVFFKNNFGTQIDAFVYGDSDYSDLGWDSEASVKLKKGRLAKRNIEETYQDTNTSSDWQNLREYGIAQSDFQTETFIVNGGLEPFTSPDSSFEVISNALALAQTTIVINLYEFTNTALANKLISTLDRGVDVKLFLEGAPVGGINATELYIARQIVENGGYVRIMTNDEDNDIHQRYSYDHAKYLVIDNSTLILMSENWGWTGVPPTGKWGNRGWGIRIDDTSLAKYFADLFYTDWEPKMKDSVPFDSSHAKWNDGANYSSEGYDSPAVFESGTVNTTASVTPVIAPDTSLAQDTIFHMLANAQDTVYVEQFYIYKHWGERDTGSVNVTPNLYLEAVIDAARRGCEVKILIDASYYNTDPDDPIDNDDTVEYVNSLAESEGLNMEAKLVNMFEHDFTKIHNKGMIADDSVLISSINWNLNSVTRNREAGLIILNQDVAEYFKNVFEYDWTDDLTPPLARFNLSETYLINEMVQFNASESTDNMEIVNYTWFLDDTLASYDIVWERPFTTTGNHTADLKVSDYWGNTNTTAHDFSVVPIDEGDNSGPNNNGTDNNSGQNRGDSTALIIGLVLLAPIAVFIGLLYIIRAKRR